MVAAMAVTALAGQPSLTAPHMKARMRIGRMM